jgi:hypothetical protein
MGLQGDEDKSAMVCVVDISMFLASRGGATSLSAATCRQWL